MTLTQAEMAHLLKLSALEISDTEQQAYQTQLAAILTYMNHLNELELDDYSPTDYLSVGETPLREDVITSQDMDLSLNAPALKDNCFVVPRIVEE